MKSFLNNDETLSDRTRNKGNVNGLDDLVYLTRWDNKFDFGNTKVRAGFRAFMVQTQRASRQILKYMEQT